MGGSCRCSHHQACLSQHSLPRLPPPKPKPVAPPQPALVAPTSPLSPRVFISILFHCAISPTAHPIPLRYRPCVSPKLLGRDFMTAYSQSAAPQLSFPLESLPLSRISLTLQPTSSQYHRQHNLSAQQAEFTY